MESSLADWLAGGLKGQESGGGRLWLRDNDGWREKSDYCCWVGDD
jgi:hypothetical protein